MINEDQKKELVDFLKQNLRIDLSVKVIRSSNKGNKFIASVYLGKDLVTSSEVNLY